MKPAAPAARSTAVGITTASATAVFSYSGATSTTTVLSTTGDSVDSVTVSNGGLNTSETEGGLTTTTQVSYPSTGGEVDTTTNPDGTQLVDTYTQGLLASAVTLGNPTPTPTGTTQSPVTTETYGYDSLQRNNSTTDWTGTTTYTLRADGSISGETLPDGRTSSVTDDDPATDAPTATQRTDGTTVNATWNTLGEQTSQSGAGQVAANFGYNQTTGQLSSISTFASGTLNSGPGATTSFGYSQYTGLPTSTTYADNSQQVLHYNKKLQVDNVNDYGANGSQTLAGTLGYNTVGQLISASYTDLLSGSDVSDAVNTIDDMGRPGITTETAQNPKTRPAQRASPPPARRRSTRTSSSPRINPAPAARPRSTDTIPPAAPAAPAAALRRARWKASSSSPAASPSARPTMPTTRPPAG